MNNFYIVSLPRSRSLWFSHYLSTNNCFCYHEFHISQPNKLLPKFNDMIIGSADTNAGNHQNYNDNPVIIIKREINEVIKSCIKSFNIPKGVNNWKVFVNNFIINEQEILNKLNPKNCYQVNFNDINNINILKKIHSFIGVSFDINRANLFIDSRIETMNRNIEPILLVKSINKNMKYQQYIDIFDKI